jgi:hypothetical protein
VRHLQQIYWSYHTLSSPLRVHSSAFNRIAFLSHLKSATIHLNSALIIHLKVDLTIKLSSPDLFPTRVRSDSPLLHLRRPQLRIHFYFHLHFHILPLRRHSIWIAALVSRLIESLTTTICDHASFRIGRRCQSLSALRSVDNSFARRDST